MESEADFARLIKKKSIAAPIAMHKSLQTILNQIDDQIETDYLKQYMNKQKFALYSNITHNQL